MGFFARRRVTQYQQVAVVQRKIVHLLEQRDQGDAKGAQTVLHPGRYVGVEGADDDTVALQLLELGGEHLLAHLGQAAAQVAKTQGLFAQMKQNGRLPFAGQQAQYLIGGTGQ